MIEKKVTAATFAAMVTSLVMSWLLLKWPALKGLNDALETVILAAVTALLTFGAGWLAKHTARPDLPPTEK